MISDSLESAIVYLCYAGVGFMVVKSFGVVVGWMRK